MTPAISTGVRHAQIVNRLIFLRLQTTDRPL